jgi:RNA polymerase sigma factor (sigma-70 family)
MNTLLTISTALSQSLASFRYEAPGALRRNDWGSLIMRGKTDGDPLPDMAELLRAVANERDLAAFETLFRHYAPRVKAYMARLGGSGPHTDELMQETMIAVWNKAERFDGSKGSVSTWIFTIARNIRIDAFRRERRPEFDPLDPAFVPDDPSPADAELDERQAAEQLHAAIATLPKDQASLLKLSFFEDQSHSAIAAQLKLPIGTVKSRIRLAFIKLRSALTNSGDLL